MSAPTVCGSARRRTSHAVHVLFGPSHERGWLPGVPISGQRVGAPLATALARPHPAKAKRSRLYRCERHGPTPTLSLHVALVEDKTQVPQRGTQVEHLLRYEGGGGRSVKTFDLARRLPRHARATSLPSRRLRAPRHMAPKRLSPRRPAGPPRNARRSCGAPAPKRWDHVRRCDGSSPPVGLANSANKRSARVASHWPRASTAPTHLSSSTHACPGNIQLSKAAHPQSPMARPEGMLATARLTSSGAAGGGRPTPSMA